MSPTRTKSRGSSPVEATNTLIITNLPLECFDIAYLTAIRGVFAKHGEIHTWAPIRFLKRAIVTFWLTEDAERAKRALDGLVLPVSTPTRIRVYRGVHTYLRTTPGGSPTDPNNPDPFHLAPPRLEKNFLISPPGSPPVGWEPIAEDKPNAAPLAADLIAALTKLQLQQNKRKGSTEIIFEGTDGAQPIVVSVEDFGSDDDDEEPRWSYSPVQERVRIAPTALPPLIHS